MEDGGNQQGLHHCLKAGFYLGSLRVRLTYTSGATAFRGKENNKKKKKNWGD